MLSTSVAILLMAVALISHCFYQVSRFIIYSSHQLLQPYVFLRVCYEREICLLMASIYD
jgi:hypothetical protein